MVLFLIGGMFGASMVVTFANVKELNPSHTSGAALGLVNTAVVGSGALLQPLIGALLDVAWNGQMQDGVPWYDARMYVQALLILPAITFTGFIASFFLKESYCRQVD